MNEVIGLESTPCRLLLRSQHPLVPRGLRFRRSMPRIIAMQIYSQSPLKSKERQPRPILITYKKAALYHSDWHPPATALSDLTSSVPILVRMRASQKHWQQPSFPGLERTNPLHLPLASVWIPSHAHICSLGHVDTSRPPVDRDS